jgi:antitoxin CptB
MLELDWLLQRFLEREFDLLSEEHKNTFDELLDQSDPDLYSWLIDQAKPPSQMSDMIERIKFMRD